MDPEFHAHSAAFQQIRELANGVLSLRRSHSVSRNEDNLLCIGQLRGDVFQRDLAHSSSRCSCLGLHDGSERTKEHVVHLTIHRSTHQDGKNESGKSIERSGDNQHVIAKHESRGGCSKSGVGIEQ